LAAAHDRGEPRQRAERPRHAHLLARRAKVEPHAPSQPMSARVEPAAPAAALIEVAQHRQQLVSRRRDLRRQLGDALAELLELATSTPRYKTLTCLLHRFANGHLHSSCEPL